MLIGSNLSLKIIVKEPKLESVPINLCHPVNDNVIYTGVDPPGSFAKIKLLEAIYTIWTKEWTEHAHCRQSKNFLPTPDKNCLLYTSPSPRD